LNIGKPATEVAEGNLKVFAKVREVSGRDLSKTLAPQSDGRKHNRDASGKEVFGPEMSKTSAPQKWRKET
jgi:hypothetical protein